MMRTNLTLLLIVVGLVGCQSFEDFLTEVGYGDFDAKVYSTKIGSDAFRVNANAGHDAGRNYADACFDIGAARAAIRNGHAYFIILDQSMQNSPETKVSTMGGYSFHAKGSGKLINVPATSSSSTKNHWTKTGTIKTFYTKPSSQYVFAYSARQTLGKHSLDVRNMCGG